MANCLQTRWPGYPEHILASKQSAHIEGEVQVHGPVHCPESITIIRKGECKTLHFNIPAGGHGMYWEADEAGLCIQDGKLESSIIPWDKSVTILEVVDKIRVQVNYSYPEQIESTQYPLSLKKKAS